MNDETGWSLAMEGLPRGCPVLVALRRREAARTSHDGHQGFARASLASYRVHHVWMTLVVMKLAKSAVSGDKPSSRGHSSVLYSAYVGTDFIKATRGSQPCRVST